MSEFVEIYSPTFSDYQRDNILNGTYYELLIDDIQWFRSAHSFFEEWNNCQTFRLMHKYKSFKKIEEKLDEEFNHDAFHNLELLVKSVRQLWLKECSERQQFSLAFNQNSVIQKILEGDPSTSKDQIKNFHQSLMKHDNDLLDFCNHIDKTIQFYENRIRERQNPLTSKNEKIASTAFALFCSILHQSDIFKMKDDESKTAFCKRVTKAFDFEINPNKVRQTFYENMEIKLSDSTLENVLNQILPYISRTIAVQIHKFIYLRATSNLQNSVQKKVQL